MSDEETPPKVYPVAHVCWSDAHGGAAGWQNLDEFDDTEPCIVTTVGFLVPADEPGGKKDHVTLWQTITDGEGINPFHIPVQMIRKITVLCCVDSALDS